MREFRNRKPILVVGGRADDYLGEYMAGGIVLILALDALDREDVQNNTQICVGSSHHS
ncbi:MAG: hypothetical protein QXI97_03575 [Nitrososphaerota archaeon]